MRIMRGLLFPAAFFAALLLGPGNSSPLPQLGTQVAAFTLPPPVKKPPVAAKYGGNKGKVNVGKAIANGAVCTIGGVVIDKLSDVTPTLLETFGNTIICNGVALIVPGPPGLGGFFVGRDADHLSLFAVDRHEDVPLRRLDMSTAGRRQGRGL